VYTFYGEDEVRSMLTAAGFASVECAEAGPAVLARATAV
jgi:hypothetical protein